VGFTLGIGLLIDIIRNIFGQKTEQTETTRKLVVYRPPTHKPEILRTPAHKPVAKPRIRRDVETYAEFPKWGQLTPEQKQARALEEALQTEQARRIAEKENAHAILQQNSMRKNPVTVVTSYSKNIVHVVHGPHCAIDITGECTCLPNVNLERKGK
jgi:hypothetical protein